MTDAKPIGSERHYDDLLAKIAELEADLKRAKDYDLTAAVLVKDMEASEKLQLERENVARLSEALKLLMSAILSNCYEDDLFGKTGEGWAFIDDVKAAREALDWLKKRRKGNE